MLTDDNNSFKLLLIFYTIEVNMQPLNRQQTEDLILDLYYNQKKTFREIQKLVRKSPRDIRAILNKIEPERSSSSLSKSSQAYKMFSVGSSPIQIAIALNLREKEANEFYREYWRLNGLHNLNQIYDEIKDNLWSVIDLCKQVKAENMSIQHIIGLLKIANNDIPSIEYRCRELEREEASLNARNKHAAGIYQQFIDQISRLNKRKEEWVSACMQQNLEVARLQLRRMRQKAVTDWFENNDEKYLIIKEIVKLKVEDALEDRRMFLIASLRSLIQSLRKEPNRFYAYYFNTPSRKSLLEGGQCNQDNKDRQDYEDRVIDEAERLYSRTVEDITNEAITSLGDNNSSMSSSTQEASSEQNRDDAQISTASLRCKDVSTFYGVCITETESLPKFATYVLPCTGS